MNYNCSMTEKIIGILVIVVALWPKLALGYATWVLVILGVVLIWHAFRCTNCAMPAQGGAMKSMPVKVAKKSAKKKKK